MKKTKKLDFVKNLMKMYEKIEEKEIEEKHLLIGQDVFKRKKLKEQIIRDQVSVFHYVGNTMYDLCEIIMEKYNYDTEKAYKYLNDKLNKLLSKEEI